MNVILGNKGICNNGRRGAQCELGAHMFRSSVHGSYGGAPISESRSGTRVKEGTGDARLNTDCPFSSVASKRDVGIARMAVKISGLRTYSECNT